MSTLEVNLEAFIEDMKKDISITESFISGEDIRIDVMLSVQKSMIAELEELLEDSRSHAG